MLKGRLVPCKKWQGVSISLFFLTQVKEVVSHFFSSETGWVLSACRLWAVVTISEIPIAISQFY